MNAMFKRRVVAITRKRKWLHKCLTFVSNSYIYRIKFTDLVIINTDVTKVHKISITVALHNISASIMELHPETMNMIC